MTRYINADDFVKEMNDRIEAATKWGVNAIVDRNEETRVRAEQAIASFCEASLTAKKIPTADVVERRRGKWLYLDGLDAFECSVCGRQMVRNIFDYCPWCGAEMRERRTDDDRNG